ncbi:cysteine hydrolase family protein [Candidatus Enterococcus ikei]|uniref:Cysteine hydrolase n=1 Tax=Candidatus Enterococcus ikei TaxID=2815326 RepID=A0ABS3H0Y2_9ENTE|nr:cysteine hydrolase family protein [Enterococcus sp. DIV0869a]MBO0441181.1 cysteine hydrolase [Enterococcus sp. DIV0869a]
MNSKALIVIDLQNGLENGGTGLFHLTDILAGVNQRIADYRKNHLPILFIQHEDSDLVVNNYNWQLFDQLDARPEDFYVSKTHANSFYQTQLKEVLDEHAITELEFCGAQTEYCVDTTIRMAHGLGYTCSMKRGLTTTLNNDLLDAQTIIQHHETLWDQRFLTFI